MFRTLRFYHSFFKFLSTPSSRRATGAARHHATVPTYFYPRPPRGGRPKTKFITFGVEGISIHALREEGDFGMGVILSDIAVISIHALREEGDARADGQRDRADHFYPRPPRGGQPRAAPHLTTFRCISIHALREEGDPQFANLGEQPVKFLSTPSARRATYVQDCYQVIVNISIHALREEGDPAIGPPPFSGYRFLSTPSARRATACLLPQPYQ